MSTESRHIERRRAKKNGAKWPTRPQVAQQTRNGYRTLHPTRGWRYVSARRLAAIAEMNNLLNPAFEA